LLLRPLNEFFDGKRNQLGFRASGYLINQIFKTFICELPPKFRLPKVA
jgi:hypothetical protein